MGCDPSNRDRLTIPAQHSSSDLTFTQKRGRESLKPPGRDIPRLIRDIEVQVHVRINPLHVHDDTRDLKCLFGIKYSRNGVMCPNQRSRNKTGDERKDPDPKLKPHSHTLQCSTSYEDSIRFPSRQAANNLVTWEYLPIYPVRSVTEAWGSIAHNE